MEFQPLAKARPRPLVTVRALQAVVAVLLAARLIFIFFVEPIGDEAYYWVWGQHPDLSYFDHPPLNAWLLGLSAQVFGWNVFGLRFPGLVTTLGSALIFWLWSRRIDTEDRTHWFWLAVAAYFAMPIISIFSGMMFPDHLLIFLCLWSLYAFSRFFETWDAGHPAWRHLFIATFVLGLAALSKYSAVFVGIAVALHILLSPIRWRLLRCWQLYAAALICLLVLSPVLVWNATHGFASFRFHLTERYSDLIANASLERFGYFWLFAVLYIGPFLVVPIIRMLFSRQRPAIATTGRDIGRLSFLGSSAVFGFLGANGALPYWNIVAYIALFPHLVTWLGARVQLIAHLCYGLLVTGLFLVNYAVIPVVHIVGGSDWESSVVYGWDEIAAHVAEAEAEYDPDFLAAARYTIAAQLSFARGRDDVTALSSRIDQYDIWFDPAAHRGQSALILADAVFGVDAETQASFASLTEVARFDTTRFGKTMMTWIIYLAEGYGEGSVGLPAKMQ